MLLIARIVAWWLWLWCGECVSIVGEYTCCGALHNVRKVITRKVCSRNHGVQEVWIYASLTGWFGFGVSYHTLRCGECVKRFAPPTESGYLRNDSRGLTMQRFRSSAGELSHSKTRSGTAPLYIWTLKTIYETAALKYKARWYNEVFLDVEEMCVGAVKTALCTHILYGIYITNYYIVYFSYVMNQERIAKPVWYKHINRRKPINATE